MCPSPIAFPLHCPSPHWPTSPSTGGAFTNKAHAPLTKHPAGWPKMRRQSPRRDGDTLSLWEHSEVRCRGDQLHARSLQAQLRASYATSASGPSPAPWVWPGSALWYFQVFAQKQTQSNHSLARQARTSLVSTSALTLSANSYRVGWAGCFGRSCRNLGQYGCTGCATLH